jgi:hypothetical protein
VDRETLKNPSKSDKIKPNQTEKVTGDGWRDGEDDRGWMIVDGGKGTMEKAG